MKILNLDNNKQVDYIDFKNKDYINNFLILSLPNEEEKLKAILNIGIKDTSNRLNINTYEKCDVFNLNMLTIEKYTFTKYKVNIYMGDDYIAIVSDENSYIYTYIEQIISDEVSIKERSKIALFKLNYLIFSLITINTFEMCEKVEDIILSIEDNILEKATKNHPDKINNIRNISRIMVKNIRPLLYIDDKVIKENIRYLKNKEVKSYYIENFRYLDLEVDKLYKFALSNRELSDKLLDIYSSKITEKTNDLISKLTLLTAITSPITIITGIYGMNFKYMPELNYVYSYPIIILIMLIIVAIGIYILRKNKIL